MIEAAPDFGISTLTLYAFSEDNWSRPPREVSALMKLLGRYLIQETNRCIETGVRITAIGRRDRLPAPVVSLLEERTTDRTLPATPFAPGTGLFLAHRDPGCGTAVEESASEEDFSSSLGPDVDLLIRTSGEQRLSDFLLWEAAYAELIFTPRMWPAFGREDLAARG